MLAEAETTSLLCGTGGPLHVLMCGVDGCRGKACARLTCLLVMMSGLVVPRRPLIKNRDPSHWCLRNTDACLQLDVLLLLNVLSIYLSIASTQGLSGFCLVLWRPTCACLTDSMGGMKLRCVFELAKVSGKFGFAIDVVEVEQI